MRQRERLKSSVLSLLYGSIFAHCLLLEQRHKTCTNALARREVAHTRSAANISTPIVYRLRCWLELCYSPFTPIMISGKITLLIAADVTLCQSRLSVHESDCSYIDEHLLHCKISETHPVVDRLRQEVRPNGCDRTEIDCHWIARPIN